MSYGPPRPKSTYGDTDFFDDSAPSSQTNYVSGEPIDTAIRPPPPIYSSPISPSGSFASPSNSSQLQSGVPARLELTQEDILFMKQLQKRIIWGSVLPGMIVGTIGIHFLNNYRNVPQSFSRYLMGSFSGFFLGAFLASGRNRDFILQSDLDTPAMRLLKSKANPRFMSGASPFTTDNNLADRSLQGSPMKGEMMVDEARFTGQPVNNWAQSPGETYLRDDELPKRSNTSYDELRAKNRGYMR